MKLNDTVLVRIPLALDAELIDSVGNVQVINPPTLMIRVDRLAFENDPKPIMNEIYNRVDSIQRIARRKGLSIIDLLKDKGWIE